VTSILLVDDDDKALEELRTALMAIFSREEQVDVRTWVPRKGDIPKSHFDSLVDDGTTLVITDYDLTRQGLTGLFGSSVVSWCQLRAIPIGDFSRNNASELPTEPNLFEFRVPTKPDETASFVAAVYRGFRKIRVALEQRPDLVDKKKSPAAILAGLLNAPQEESQFALYTIRYGSVNAALIDQVNPGAQKKSRPKKEALLTYMVGHLLLNSILRFSGPIVSMRGLAAYLGIDDSERETIEKEFREASYSGPFSELGPYFWLAKVNDLVEGLVKALPPGLEVETHGELHRRALERKYKREFKRPTCDRCNGLNGGFFCPFTRRTVCQRSDCSVGSNSWIPPGARLCRIERDFYDELAPILGL